MSLIVLLEALKVLWCVTGAQKEVLKQKGKMREVEEILVHVKAVRSLSELSFLI
jgi:hypothetical protein